MKNILLSIALITTMLSAGEIKNKFEEINKTNFSSIDKSTMLQLSRIEQKLDLIINEMIKKEKEDEELAKTIQESTNKAKTMINNSTNWVLEKMGITENKEQNISK